MQVLGERRGWEFVIFTFIPAEEVQRLARELELNEVGGVRGKWVKLSDAAKTLGVSREKLDKSYRRGELKATLVRRGGRPKCLVVSMDEVERLRKQIKKRERSRVRKGLGGAPLMEFMSGQ